MQNTAVRILAANMVNVWELRPVIDSIHSKMKKSLLYLLLLLLFAAALWWVLSQKSGEAIQRTRTEYTVAAGQFYSEFYDDEAAANEKYLNRIISVTGEVADFATRSNGKVVVWLSAGEGDAVKCTLDTKKEHSRQEFQKGVPATFKCTCSGLTEQVELVNCVEE